MSGRGAGLLLPVLLLALACSPARPRPETQPPSPPPRPQTGTVTAAEVLEARALLLLMADRRQFDFFSVEAVREDHRGLWPELALTLGRIGDPRGRQVLEGMLLDDRPEVRRRAVFALGRLGDREAQAALQIAVADADRATGRRAVEALARLEVPLVQVVEAALPLAPAERWARLTPELFRFAPEDVVVLAREALATAPVEERFWAIYALARKPLPAGRELLRLGLLHDDRAARAWAARGLGAAGAGSELARLRPLLEDDKAGPVVQALRAAARLIATGRGAAPASWVAPLLALMDDGRVGVRLTAIETAGHWLLEPRLGDRLARLGRDGSGRERELALLALATGGDPRAAELVGRAAGSAEYSLRAVAATAAVRIGAEDVLTRLETDRAAGVRMAVLAARLERADGRAATEARRGLIDADPAVRATALEWLAENPVAPLEEIALGILGDGDGDGDGGSAAGDGGRWLVELRLDGIAALAARAVAESLERGAIVATLERLATDEEYLVRRAAADALAELGRPRPVPEPVVTRLDLDRYRDLARRLRGRPRVDLETAHGTVGLELDCDAAPMTCHGFLQLVRQGFYDGLVFHRVVADFVVQAGDPRGDGWGGPGFTLRDEPNLIRYERGVLGMARSAPDTAGSQFFITLSPQHHLDGDYTAFGRVIDGIEVLDRIAQGDRIERLSERSEQARRDTLHPMRTTRRRLGSR